MHNVTKLTISMQNNSTVLYWLNKSTYWNIYQYFARKKTSLWYACPMESGKWIPCFDSLAYMVFALRIKLSLSQPMSFLTSTLPTGSHWGVMSELLGEDELPVTIFYHQFCSYVHKTANNRDGCSKTEQLIICINVCLSIQKRRIIKSMFRIHKSHLKAKNKCAFKNLANSTKRKNKNHNYLHIFKNSRTVMHTLREFTLSLTTVR